MSLVTIEHPSGFAHLSVEAVGDSDEPEKIEVNDESTVLYYNDLANAVAASVCLTKVQPVENPKPVYITVQDYYDPDAESSTEVQLRDLQKAGLINDKNKKGKLYNSFFNSALRKRNFKIKK